MKKYSPSFALTRTEIRQSWAYIHGFNQLSQAQFLSHLSITVLTHSISQRKEYYSTNSITIAKLSTTIKPLRSCKYRHFLVMRVQVQHEVPVEMAEQCICLSRDCICLGSGMTGCNQSYLYLPCLFLVNLSRPLGQFGCYAPCLSDLSVAYLVQILQGSYFVRDTD